MKKELKSIILPLIAILMLTQIFSAQKVNASEIEYGINGGKLLFNSKTGTITGYKGNLTKISIPEKIKGVKVINIGNYAFYNVKSEITAITLPNSIKAIGDSAFYNCEKLKSIKLPENVVSIGTYAFAGCSSLTGIEVSSRNSKYSTKDGVLFNKNMTILVVFPKGKKVSSYIIPNSVTTIGTGAFNLCSGLKNLSIPNSVKTIKVGAFQGCSGLTSITIPNGVTSIEEEAFTFCSNLSSVTIPESVKDIKKSAFRSKTLTIYGSQNSEAEKFAKENNIKFQIIEK